MARSIQLTERIQFSHARTGERAATKNNRDSQIIIFGRRPNPDGARIAVTIYSNPSLKRADVVAYGFKGCIDGMSDGM